MLADLQERPGREIVRDHWRQQWAGAGSDAGRLRTLLADGAARRHHSRHGLQAKIGEAQDDWADSICRRRRPHAAARGTDEPGIDFQPDPTIYDGSFANNGWLQELPKPITKLTWGNAAIMSPATAKQLGVGRAATPMAASTAAITCRWSSWSSASGRCAAPVWIMPGHADGALASISAMAANAPGGSAAAPQQSVGFNAYRLRTAEQPWFAAGLQVRQDRLARELVACTQAAPFDGEPRPGPRGTLAEYRQHPHFAAEPESEKQREERPADAEAADALQAVRLRAAQAQMGHADRPDGLHRLPGLRGGMPGREQHSRRRQGAGRRRPRNALAANRSLHRAGTDDDPQEFHFQPVPCMHCENAPCEYVCPVAATVHSAEGLNDMIYQRCVGTRFCSNNCPYKVRRFNFFAYADFATPSRRLQYNPDVTVRSRGVMEKCTYCVQRIRHAEIDAEKEGRPHRRRRSADRLPGRLPDAGHRLRRHQRPASQVKQGKDSPCTTRCLADLNTQPRTTYLAALRNPNPDIEAA